MKYILFVFAMLSISSCLYGQKDSTDFKQLRFTGDFRFRIEHDWNSRKSNGVLRDDRSRLRYRFRFGLNYAMDQYSSFGGRVRTGNLNDQQGPHITLGAKNGEFGLVEIGFEKLFYQFKRKKVSAWIGKNTMPLKKLNELFWNDNVFPEGVGIKLNPHDDPAKFLSQLKINLGHFIIQANNQTFDKDSYLQIAQLDVKFLKNRFRIFPGLYTFKKIGNFPDGKQVFDLDYSIFHLGVDVQISTQPKISLGVEWYQNFENYSNLDSIPDNLNDQKKGFVISAKYGQVKRKGDWLIHLYYAYLEKFSVVDYFAQNDWARWDYASIGATGSRITNFQGVELQVGYAINEKFNLILRSYFVEELVPLGAFKEDGSRIRLDLNIGF